MTEKQDENADIGERNLRYQAVTLMVPYRDTGGNLKPEDWDWAELADVADPIWVSSAEPIPYDDMIETLVANGFDDHDTAVVQLAPDEQESGQ